MELLQVCFSFWCLRFILTRVWSVYLVWFILHDVHGLYSRTPRWFHSVFFMRLATFTQQSLAGNICFWWHLSKDAIWYTVWDKWHPSLYLWGCRVFFFFCITVYTHKPLEFFCCVPQFILLRVWSTSDFLAS